MQKTDIGVPILRNVFTNVDFASAEVSVPQSLANKLDLDKPSLPLDGLITLALGVLTTLIYWSPIAMQNKFIVSNVIAWALGMVRFLRLICTHIREYNMIESLLFGGLLNCLIQLLLFLCLH